YCPSNAHYNTTNNPNFFSYEMVEGATDPGDVSRYCGLAWCPFGYNNGTSANRPTVTPYKQSDLVSMGSIAQIWAMVDSDQEGNSGAGPAPNFPPIPPHGSTRNYLWFDWHVAPVKVPPASTGDGQNHKNPYYGWE